MKKSAESDRKIINRREFLFTLGIGATAAISGYYISDSFINSEQIKSSLTSKKTSDKPLLKESVKTYYENNSLFLTNNNIKYCVNQTGAEVVQLLDGNYTINDISKKIAAKYGIEHNGSLDTSISKFICQLARSEFLSQPFYVTIFENYG